MDGVIAAASEHAVEAGAKVFRCGGNAVDAAIAATWASFVAEMSLVNIGGGGYATVCSAQENTKPAFYDFFCAMPTGELNPSMDFRGIEIDFGTEQQTFFIGRGSTAVPGVVAGLCQLSRERGRLPLAHVLQPAIELANSGFEVDEWMAKVFRLLQPIFEDTPLVKSAFSHQGRWIREGDRLNFPRLGQSMGMLAQQGSEYFYRGPLAGAIEADHRKHGGLIQAKDLAGYRVIQATPLKMEYRDGEVLLPPPPSLGGSLIAFTLALLQSIPLGKTVQGSVAHVRAWAHALRLTSEARNRGRSTDNFLNEYKERLLLAISGRDSIVPGTEAKGPSHTSHISAMDSDGTTVSITTSAGESAGYLIPGSGLLMNNILGELDLNPNGFHRHPPGSRLRSMMSPIIYCQNGRPVLALGSAGSNRLRSAIIQTLSYAIDFGLKLDAAVNAPRLHYEDGILQVEPGFPEPAIQALEDDGFRIRRWQKTHLFFGGAQVVANFGDGFQAGADHRRGGCTRQVIM